MPDSQQPPTTDGNGQDPTPEQQEAKFWEQHETRTRAILDKWLDDAIKKYAKTGTSRTGGRTTLPQIVAGFMFGTDKTP